MSEVKPIKITLEEFRHYLANQGEELTRIAPYFNISNFEDGLRELQKESEPVF